MQPYNQATVIEYAPNVHANVHGQMCRATVIEYTPNVHANVPTQSNVESLIALLRLHVLGHLGRHLDH